jgi:hypothetical protein
MVSCTTYEEHLIFLRRLLFSVLSGVFYMHRLYAQMQVCGTLIGCCLRPEVQGRRCLLLKGRSIWVTAVKYSSNGSTNHGMWFLKDFCSGFTQLVSWYVRCMRPSAKEHPHWR